MSEKTMWSHKQLAGAETGTPNNYTRQRESKGIARSSPPFPNPDIDLILLPPESLSPLELQFLIIALWCDTRLEKACFGNKPGVLYKSWPKEVSAWASVPAATEHFTFCRTNWWVLN